MLLFKLAASPEFFAMDMPLFLDRADATAQLIKQLPPIDPESTWVLGIPRGGVPMAAEIARTLHVPMDVLLVRKLSTPANPEYAIGAVSLDHAWIDEAALWPQQSINPYIEEARAVLKERDQKYRQRKPLPDLHGKTVLLVDDGIATGRTLLHAIQILQVQKPKAIWVVVPLSSREAADRIRPLVDRFICIHQPHPFIGVGRFYGSFPAVSDEEVIRSMTGLLT